MTQGQFWPVLRSPQGTGRHFVRSDALGCLVMLSKAEYRQILRCKAHHTRAESNILGRSESVASTSGTLPERRCAALSLSVVRIGSRLHSQHKYMLQIRIRDVIIRVDNICGFAQIRGKLLLRPALFVAGPPRRSSPAYVRTKSLAPIQALKKAATELLVSRRRSGGRCTTPSWSHSRCRNSTTIIL